MAYVAVIDVGNTRVKVCVTDGAGKTVAAETSGNRIVEAAPYAHVDVDEIWQWLLGALGRAAADYRIAAVVPTTYAATCALIGDDGRPVLPVMHHSHRGIEEVDDAYEAVARRFRETLSPRLPFGQNLGRQLYWQARRFPEAFGQVRRILTYPQYWAWRLSGVAASEVTSLGAHSDLWCPAAHDFSQLARDEGWVGLFPPLQPAWAKLGPVSPAIVDATGLAADCRVHNGVHDSNASFVRHLVGRRDTQFTVVSTGTWVINFAAGRPTDGLDETRDTLANTDVFGAAVAGSRFMGGREFEAIAGGVAPDIAADDSDARWLVERETMAVPSFAPEVGPFQGHVGEILGPPPETDRQRVALASLYCALVTDQCLTLIDARGDMIIEGRFTENPLYCRLLAALRPGQRTRLSSDATGTVAGAALLARWPPARVAIPLEDCAAAEIAGLDRYRRAWAARIAAR